MIRFGPGSVDGSGLSPTSVSRDLEIERGLWGLPVAIRLVFVDLSRWQCSPWRAATSTPGVGKSTAGNSWVHTVGGSIALGASRAHALMSGTRHRRYGDRRTPH